MPLRAVRMIRVGARNTTPSPYLRRGAKVPYGQVIASMRAGLEQIAWSGMWNVKAGGSRAAPTSSLLRDALGKDLLLQLDAQVVQVFF
jgi:hypothetical protein